MSLSSRRESSRQPETSPSPATQRYGGGRQGALEEMGEESGVGVGSVKRPVGESLPLVSSKKAGRCASAPFWGRQDPGVPRELTVKAMRVKG